MEDALKSGIGGETSDAVVRSISDKPVWLLTPIPLSQLDPSHVPAPPSSSSPFSASISAGTSRIGPPPSLRTSCLDTISTAFHLYDPTSLVGLAPDHVRRIIDKVRADRHYVEPDAATMLVRPDEATVWAYGLLADPEGAGVGDREADEASLTLGLDMSTLVRHLAPNPRLDPPDHPFVALPKLYKQLQPYSPFRLLTTLTFDGSAGGGVDDASIMALRYATHLTALWTTQCRVTDVGVRLLAAALRLPGDESEANYGVDAGAGMWRLRAWFLRGCYGVGDRSMRSFARWPGLVTLDVRDTSCTTAGARIFNDTLRLLLPSLAPLQPVNPGLRAIFATRSAPGIIIEQLSDTLLSMRSPHTHPGMTLCRSLNLVPSRVVLPVSCLPETTAKHVAARLQSSTTPHGPPAGSTVFRTGGLGQLYGAGVAGVADETAQFRETVKTAVMLQAVSDGLMDDPRDKARREADKARDWDTKHRKKMRDNKAYKKRFQRGYKSAKEDGEEERKRKAAAAAAGLQVGCVRMEVKEEEVKGESGLMLVRVAQEGWERLTWETSMSAVQGSGVMGTTKARRNDLVGEILGTLGGNTGMGVGMGTTAGAGVSSASLGSPASATSARTCEPLSGTPTLPRRTSSPLQPRPSNPNPFRSTTATAAARLPGSGSSPPDPPAFTKRPAPSQSRSRSRSRSPTAPLLGKPDLGFAPIKKRRFGGAAGVDESASRRGLKMFSGPRK